MSTSAGAGTAWPSWIGAGVLLACCGVVTLSASGLTPCETHESHVYVDPVYYLDGVEVEADAHEQFALWGSWADVGVLAPDHDTEALECGDADHVMAVKGAYPGYCLERLP